MNRRFEVPFTVVQGGSGQVNAILSETDQQAQPSYIFVQPRHVLRTDFPTGLRSGMVVRAPGGQVFICGDNGPSETHEGTIWQSFRLFEPTGKYLWQRRMKVIDPITRLPMDDSLQTLGTIYAAIEPIDREAFDRQIRVNFEQVRFITGSPVQDDDLIDNRAITKVDKQLGCYIGVLT
ncbi:MAG: hypothetical protein ACTHJR_16560 [Sphingomonas sp.]|uniref:hypothetical protein n=1 Tax=Sphingomonas sp. TaxID=28214 RepID=UPI003F7F9EDF